MTIVENFGDFRVVTQALVSLQLLLGSFLFE